MKKFLLSLLTLATCISAWGAKIDTLDFTVNNFGLPTSAVKGEAKSYTYQGKTITLYGDASNGFKYNSTDKYLIFGKKGGYLTLPVVNYQVSKIVVVGRDAASASVEQNIFVGEDAVSTKTVGATGTNTFNINEDYQAAGTTYTLKVISKHNNQVTKVYIYEKSDNEVSAPTITPGSCSLTQVPSQITIEGPEGAAIYYTVDGSTPTTNSLLYSAPFDITGACEVKAIAVKNSQSSDVTTATYTYTFNGPAISPESMTFRKPFNATITVPENATVYYTVDGTEPTVSSNQYTAPIAIPAASTTIKAISKDQYGNLSKVSVVGYTYDAPASWTNSSLSLVFNESNTLTSSDVSTAWKTTSPITEVFKNGADYVSGIDSLSNVYQARIGRGAKFGTGSAAGSIKIQLGATVTLTKVEVECAGYGSSEKPGFVIMGKEYASNTYGSTMETLTYVPENPTETNVISIATKEKRGYVKSIKVYFTMAKYKRSTTDGNYGTICLPHAVAADARSGATFYNIAGVRKTGEAISGVVLEEETGALVAGKPYVFKATAETLTATYSGDAVAEAVAATGMVGTLAAEGISLTTEGKYILSNNKICKLAGGTATIAQNRAYFDLDAVGVVSAPSAHAVIIDVEEEGSANGLEAVSAIKSQEMYDITGRRVNAATKGMFIIDGKKVIVK